MEVVFKILSILYGGLSILASISASREEIEPKWSFILMGLSGALLIFVSIKVNINKFIILLPLLLLHISAYINGVYMGKTNISHHIFRFILSLTIFAINIIV